MAKSLLDNVGLKYFWQKIKSILDEKADKSDIPDISVKTDDVNEYVLTISDQNGVIETPNLKASSAVYVGSDEVIPDNYYIQIDPEGEAIEMQISPYFADNIEELEKHGETDKLYVLPDGYIYAYTKTTETKKVYDNLADTTSTDWIKGYRLSNSSGTTEASGYSITNFIPCSLDDFIYIKNCPKLTQGYALMYYDESKMRIGLLYPNIDYVTNIEDLGIEGNYYYDSESGISIINAGRYINETSGINNVYTDTAYIRLSIPTEADDVIITVNQEIIEEDIEVTSYRWMNTDVKFITSDIDKTAVQNIIQNEIHNNISSMQVELDFANSIEDCVDEGKVYILPDGFIYKYGELETEVVHNAYDPSTAKFNYRLSSSGAEVFINGGLLLDYIEQSYDPDCVVTISGIEKLISNYSSVFVVDFFDKSKNRIAGAQCVNNDYEIYVSTDEKQLPISFNIFKPTESFDGIENVGYVRIKLGITSVDTSISAEDCEGLVVNFSTKNGLITNTGWINTNHAFAPADYEYLVNELKDEVKVHKERIAVLESVYFDNGTGGIPEEWGEAVDKCITDVKTNQAGKDCVTFAFFSDNHQRNGYSGLLISKIMKECGIPYCFYGGDTISSGYLNEDKMIAQDKAFDNIMSHIPYGRFCRAVGNHDGYWNDNEVKGFYSRSQIYELFLREEGISQNKHFGNDGTYYYIDDIVSKVRFIVLNTNGDNGEENVDDIQLSWLQNTALSFNEEGWEVVIISHHPISNHYHSNISNASEVISIVINSGVKIIGWFSGHIHRDRIYTHSAVNSGDGVEGSDGDELGFTQITITSDHTAIAYDDATKHAADGSIESHAIDFVTINKNTGMVNITRLGIGDSRSYQYKEVI
ncbi:MAG: hypothetical protein IJA34_01040 [Lachnospiraceae bacterium]|nr:hypothetical protein [Lachnospiraceae bacterium]